MAVGITSCSTYVAESSKGMPEVMSLISGWAEGCATACAVLTFYLKKAGTAKTRASRRPSSPSLRSREAFQRAAAGRSKMSGSGRFSHLSWCSSNSLSNGAVCSGGVDLNTCTSWMTKAHRRCISTEYNSIEISESFMIVCRKY